MNTIKNIQTIFSSMIFSIEFANNMLLVVVYLHACEWCMLGRKYIKNPSIALYKTLQKFANKGLCLHQLWRHDCCGNIKICNFAVIDDQ